MWYLVLVPCAAEEEDLGGMVLPGHFHRTIYMIKDWIQFLDLMALVVSL